jgi:hypothetical protein
MRAIGLSRKSFELLTLESEKNQGTNGLTPTARQVAGQSPRRLQLGFCLALSSPRFKPHVFKLF